MKVRSRQLPPGWYPRGGAAVRAEIESMLASKGPLPRIALAGIAPHAGWSFSGAVAARVVASLDPAVDTLAVVGGHLGASAGILAAREEGYETPLGACSADLQLLDYHLDLPGCQLGVFQPLATGANDAVSGYNPFATDRACQLVHLGLNLGVKYQLGYACPVTQINEYQIAMVAIRVGPAS